MELKKDKKGHLNNYLCVGTEILSVNNFPNIMKEYIFDGLIKGERIIIFTDDLFYKDLEWVFQSNESFIRQSINIGNLKIKTYDAVDFHEEYGEFLDLIEILTVVKQKLRIIWDFKNVAKRIGKLEVVTKCVQNILRSSRDNIFNMIYIDNNNYNSNQLDRLSKLFQQLIVIDKNKELQFIGQRQIEQGIWLLQSNAQLKYQNRNLVLFNDIFSNIPKTTDENEFKKIIMSKVKDICDIDFCILHSSTKEKENIIAIDSYFGMTKRHKYHLINDREAIYYQNKFNEQILNTGAYFLLNLNEVSDIKLKEKIKALGIVSYLGIAVEYYGIVKGVMWIGRYESNREISKQNIEHMESICRTAFYLVQEHKQFLDMQSRLIESEKLRAMGEMAAGITHDINNILTPILGCVQLLKDNVKDKHILKQLSIIEICAYDGMNITNKVKKLTKTYNNEELETFFIDEVLSDAIHLTKNKWLTESILKGIKINIVQSLKANKKIQGNITEIREVFINILTNAVDAMHRGGKIEISTRAKEKEVVIEIRDNGIGMNEEIMKRVFEPFFTTKGNKGSGLGLSISYKIIQSHKGNIHIESEENVGTSFLIKLPIYDKEEVYQEVKVIEGVDFTGNILVIDDQEKIRNVVSDMIKSITKCKIKTCDCTNIAMELRRRKYDIIICDFSMPDMDGLEVAGIVKDFNQDTYFCLMTGWVGVFDEQEMQDVDFVLSKPINKEKIKEMFNAYANNSKKEG